MALPNDCAFGHGDHVNGGAPGITMREHFASLAMQGLMSVNWSDVPGGMSRDNLVIEAVRTADALIVALHTISPERQ